MPKRIFFDEDESNEEDNTNIYSRRARESLLEDDEISPGEEGFMSGYDWAI